MKPFQTPQKDDRYFIHHVTETGESRSVSASEHIFSQNGIKLLAKGAPINRGVFDRLVAHKLLRPLEASILVDGVLTAFSIRSDVINLVARSSDLQSLGSERTALYQIPGRLFIHPTIATKLTILKDRIPWLYTSACISAALALHFGARLGLDDSELEMLVSAAIFHDIGELHIDPAILDQEGSLNPEQWRHIFTHPVTGYLMLASIPDYKNGTARLVLEHHERADGSGYPAGLLADELHSLSPAMAIIDTFVSQFDANGRCANPEGLGVILRLVAHKFDQGINTIGLEMANLISKSRKDGGGDDIPSQNAEVLLGGITRFLDSWRGEIRPQLEGRSESLLTLLDRRVRLLEIYLNRAGLDPANIGAAQSILSEEPALHSEATAVLKEADWHRRGISTELHRIFPNLPEEIGDQKYEALISWLK